MEKNRKNPPISIWHLSTLGTEFGFIFILFVFLGDYIDDKLNSKPIGILICLILGFSAALYHILKKVNEYNESNKKDL
jgi:F0F1-type ATP synthase assembly protein I